MSYEVIYERKYGDIIRNLYDQAENDANKLQFATTKDSKEYAKNLLSNYVRVLLPDRIEKKNNFIKMAKEIGEEYMIDLVISANDTYIAAMYSLECNIDFHCMKEIISQADELSFGVDGDKELLTLILYTHATYSFGRKISPMDD